MTTLLGIYADEGIEGIVLASDIQVSLFEEKRLTDRRKHGRKIIVGPNFALAHAGDMEKPLYAFKRYINGLKQSEQREMILRTIQKYKDNPHYSKGWGLEPHFKEINELNTAIMRQNNDIEKTVNFILAVNEPELGLYVVDECGNLKEPSKELPFKYLTIGTGSEKIEGYITNGLNDDKIDISNLTINNSLMLIDEAFDRAEQEINTSGPPDYVILTINEIDPFGNEIREAMVGAKKNKLIEKGKKYTIREKPKEGTALITNPE